MLEIKNLKKIYKTQSTKDMVLKGITATIMDGEFVAIMGASGSGKTTLLNTMSGFIKSDGGEVLLDGENLLSQDEQTVAQIRQEKLGFVFQDFMLIDGLTVKENICLPQIIINKSIDEMENTTQRLMSLFGLTELGHKYPSEISGGQKQRVAIARALANHPGIIFADEPTGNLDSKSSATVIQAFVRAKEEMNATILMVTHDAFAASHCDKVIALKDGKVAKELIRKGSPKMFLEELLDFIRKINGEDYDV